jgi:hypothetical protein
VSTLPYKIIALRHEHTEHDFRCSQTELAKFFRDDAWKSEQLGLSRTFVLLLDGYTPVAGYYSLMMGRITTTDLPKGQVPTTLAQLPVAVLGKLARDERVPKDQQAGAILMVDALKRTLAVSTEIGCTGLMLDAKNEGLVRYYHDKFGLDAVGQTRYPRKMFVSMADLKASHEAGQSESG